MKDRAPFKIGVILFAICEAIAIAVFLYVKLKR
jgi:hypothetical protein